MIIELRKKSQITLPKEIVKKLNLKEGDTLDVSIKNGIINIEREVKMSGSSHSKGVLILNGYLGEMFAQDIPLCLTASICFEQLYNGVDGDSASSTECYAILSSLSGIPINQSIAVTGSVNQKGEIQAIGGVTHKIEGFFDLCKKRGLTGNQGVLIPVSNIKDLVFLAILEIAGILAILGWWLQ